MDFLWNRVGFVCGNKTGGNVHFVRAPLSYVGLPLIKSHLISDIYAHGRLGLTAVAYIIDYYLW